jgi:hypothetical protein
LLERIEVLAKDDQAGHFFDIELGERLRIFCFGGESGDLAGFGCPRQPLGGEFPATTEGGLLNGIQITVGVERYTGVERIGDCRNQSRYVLRVEILAESE